MKKVIIVLLVLLYCIDSMGQAISNRSSSTITVKDSRWMAGLNAFVPVYNDTATANIPANIGIDSCGAIIFTYDNNDIWYRGCSPKRWLRVGSGQIINDTIYTERPIAVKVDSSGRHIIYFLTARGLISGGIVSLDSCMTLDVNNTVFNLNYNQYTVPQTTGIVISAADPTFGRVDRIVVDTNLNVVVIPGMPSSSPLPAPIDIFSQFELMQITIPAGATCLSISQRIIYDQNTEWTITTSGTISQNPNNLINPYHLTKAIFVSSYHNGSSIIFTDSSPDTVTAGELLKMFIYVNGAFTNQISGQWYNGSTAVSNQISLNPYFNTNDSTKYQNLDVQFSAWNIPIGTEFDRLVLTFGGDDTSGAKGLYLDYIQIQQGLTNINTELTLTTNGSSGASTYDNVTKVLNIPVYGGGGSVTADNGLNISSGSNVQWGGTLLQNTDIDMDGNNIAFNNIGATGAFTIQDYFRISPVDGSYQLGDLSGHGFNSYLNIDDNSQTFSYRNFSETTFAIEGSQMSLNNYASGALVPGFAFLVTDTGRYKPIVIDTTNGKIYQSFWYGAGGGNTIYTGDDDLTSNRNVGLNGKTLDFSEGSRKYLSLSGVSGDEHINLDVDDGSTSEANLTLTANVSANNFTLSANQQGGDQLVIFGDAMSGDLKLTAYGATDVELDVSAGALTFYNLNSGPTLLTINGDGSQSELRAFNSADDGNSANMSILASGTEVSFIMNSDFDDGVKTANITGTSSVSLSSISYTADTHTFNGIIITATQFTPANSTDATYPNGALTEDDTFLYYRTSSGTWVKMAWIPF